MSDSERGEGEGGALAIPVTPAQSATLEGVRRYHVGLSPKQVLARLAEQPGVRAYDDHGLPDFGGLVDDSRYTLELGADTTREFRLHCGPPAARGQSGTGLLRLLYLVGRLTPTREGTQIELRFARRRPRWALQRYVGFLALASLGLLWVLIGPGVLAKKALLYGLLLLVTGPVLVHDLRRDQQLREQKLALLNLMEHVLGPVQLTAGHVDEPYRKRRRGDDDDDSWDDVSGEHELESGERS